MRETYSRSGPRAGMLAFPGRDAGQGAVHEPAVPEPAESCSIADVRGDALPLRRSSVPGVPLPQLPRLPRRDGSRHGHAAHCATRRCTEVRKLRVRELLRTERETVESRSGRPADPASPGRRACRRRLRRSSARVLQDSRCCAPKRSKGSACTLVVLQAPEGMSTRRALKKLRELDPDGQYDYNHLYLGAALQPGESVMQAPQATEADAPARSGLRIGLIDSGVDSGASRARRREHRAARLRRRGIPRAARHGRRLAAGRSGRWIRERHSRARPCTRPTFSAAMAAVRWRCSRSRSTGWRASRWPS